MKRAFYIPKAFVVAALSMSAAVAEGRDRVQAWSILRYDHELAESFFGGQKQNRYDFQTGKSFEEQLNLFYGQSFDSIEARFIFTLGTQDGYERLRETRYAGEVQKSFFIGRGFTYSLRLRQELRDFTDNDKLAHRFRWRNELTHSLNSEWVDRLFVSTEFNHYLNEYQPHARGFSSLRTILGTSGKRSYGEWGLAYVLDYRKRPGADELRHVLLVTFEFGGHELHRVVEGSLDKKRPSNLRAFLNNKN